MQLTKNTDLSLRVLMYLAIHTDRRCTIGEIAEQYQESRNHLVKVVHTLANLGYVDSVQGRNGGIRLGRDGADISVGAVVRQTEPTLTVVDCVAIACKLNRGCRLQSALAEASLAFQAVLDDYSIADLVVNEAQLRRLLA